MQPALSDRQREPSILSFEIVVATSTGRRALQRLSPLSVRITRHFGIVPAGEDFSCMVFRQTLYRIGSAGRGRLAFATHRRRAARCEGEVHDVTNSVLQT